MRGAERVVDVDVAELRKAGAERRDGGLFGRLFRAVLELHLRLLLDVESQVLQQHDIAGLERPGRARRLNGGPDAVVQELHRLGEQPGEFVGHGFQRKLRDLPAVRPSQVRHQDDRRAGVQGVLDRGESRDDPLVVRDGARDLVLGDIEVDAHQHPFAREG
jgi:hypothetical protein